MVNADKSFANDSDVWVTVAGVGQEI